jgi:pilus assembly protein Flp/PilA
MLERYIQLQTWFASLRDDERGASAVEYGLLVALIAAIIIVTVTTLGTRINGAFQKVVEKMPA